MRTLVKHTITIWTEVDLEAAEIHVIAKNAVNGDAYCSDHTTVRVADPPSDPDWDGTEFFGGEDDEYEDEDEHDGNDEDEDNEEHDEDDVGDARAEKSTP